MEKTQIVIIGGGYAGIATLKSLQKSLSHQSSVKFLLIDKNPYHTLLTELHEVAASRVKPSAVKISYSEIFSEKPDRLQIIHDEILNIDFEQKNIYSSEQKYHYDYLIIGTGSRPDFFNIEGVEAYGFKLWSYKEALIIRDRIQDCFIKASMEKNESKRRNLMRFIIAGGGFSGVEMAGDLAFFCRICCKQYNIDKNEIQIDLVEAAGDILGNMEHGIRKQVRRYLKKLKVNLITNCGVEKMFGEQILLSTGKKISGTLIWTAGIKGNPSITKMNMKVDRRERINVNDCLQSLSNEHVFSVGDTMSYAYKDKPIPQIVENAQQSGNLVGENVARMIQGKPLLPYHPRFHGIMISVGPITAVAKIGRIRLKWIFATMIKHSVNMHYHFELGGVRLLYKYIMEQWIFGFPGKQMVGIRKKEIINKQVTQF